MKIILLRNMSSGNTQSAKDYMSVVFAHISHQIHITNVLSTRETQTTFSGQEKIEVEYNIQPLLDEYEDIRKIIADAIKLRGDLTLVQLQLPLPFVDIVAIEFKNGHYEINEPFAQYLAKTPQYCQSLQKINVKEIKVRYEKFKDRLHYTGNINTSSIGNTIQFNPQNPYHCFAHAVEHDVNLRNRLGAENLLGIQMQIKKDNQVDVRLIVAESHLVNLPAVEESSKEEQTPTLRL